MGKVGPNWDVTCLLMKVLFAYVLVGRGCLVSKDWRVLRMHPSHTKGIELRVPAWWDRL